MNCDTFLGTLLYALVVIVIVGAACVLIGAIAGVVTGFVQGFREYKEDQDEQV